jgi:hypothetical protein
MENLFFRRETMSNSRYYIVGNNDVWMIQFKDTENGQHKSSSEAASFAIAAAQKLGMRGERAHVCILDDDGRLRCKWSYNRDRHLRTLRLLGCPDSRTHALAPSVLLS